jgi:hypothetical protein
MADSEQPPREEDRPVAVNFNNQMLEVTLRDGRIISTPLEWYPRLLTASPSQRANVELGVAGIYWPDLDEDLSVRGMLEGNRPTGLRRAREKTPHR